MSSRIINARLEDWSLSYDGPKFHACLCDPPYGLEFMGKEWDSYAWDARRNTEAAKLAGTGSIRNAPVYKAGNGFQQAVTGWGEAILPHLYPGALVLMFGGTRTWHRLACGMEDAGFEMWDTLMWLHGQGFPKAQDISKLIDKANGDEREVIGRNPNWRDPVNNAEHHARWNNAVITGDITKPTNFSAPWSGHKTTALKPAWEPVLCFKKPLTGTYAEMAMQYGSGALNVDGGRIGVSSNEPNVRGNRGLGRSAGGFYGEGTAFGKRDEDKIAEYEQHSGRYPANLILDETIDLPNGASRFFYSPKASSSERNAGLEGFEATVDGVGALRDGGRKSLPRRNIHPTVKPIDLCRYLATLLLPPESVKPRRLLVPFAGSGSEMIGATRAGWDEIIGIEQNAEYCDLSPSRIVGDAPLFNTVETL